MKAISKGSLITAASSISVTHDYHEITGNTNIATINPPSPLFDGLLMLKAIDATGTPNFVSGGNINIPAINVTMPRNRVVFLVYDLVNTRWDLMAGI